MTENYSIGELCRIGRDAMLSPRRIRKTAVIIADYRSFSRDCFKMKLFTQTVEVEEIGIYRDEHVMRQKKPYTKLLG